MVTNDWQAWKKGITLTSLAACISIFSQVARSPIVRADVIPDNTLGTDNTQVRSNRVEGGAARGPNLFHSFTEFSIDQGQRIEFLPGNDIQSIFSRVTGNSRSEILGTLKVSGDTDFFLINPNGVFVGRNAKLDMDGSFLASTADGIEFGEDFLFGTQNPTVPPDSLLVVQPSALIFTQLNPAAIHSQGRLRVDRGETVQLIGGDILLENRDKIIEAREGLIELGGLAAPGRVEFSSAGTLQFAEDAIRADVILRNNAGLKVDGRNGGEIRIHANDLTLDEAKLEAGIDDRQGTPSSQSGNIVIHLTGNLRATDSEISNELDQNAQGTSGDIILTIGGDAHLSDSDIAINLDRNAQGTSGDIILTIGGDIHLLDGSDIENRSRGIGQSGDIRISANNLTLDDGEIKGGFRDDGRNPRGQTGDLMINLAGNLRAIDSEISNTLGRNVRGTTGDMILTVTGDIYLEDSDIDSRIRGTGSSGDIRISANNLTLNDSEIRGGFRDDGGSPDTQAGDLVIDLAGNLQAVSSDISSNLSRDAQGTTGNIILTADGYIHLLENTKIKNELQGRGETGDILITAGGRLLLDASKIRNVFDDDGQGISGNIQIVADSLRMQTPDGNRRDRQAQISTTTGGAGDAGNISISVNQLTMIGPGRSGASGITSNSSGDDAMGDAGSILITVNGPMLMTNRGKIESVVQFDATGTGGNVVINAQSLHLSDVSAIKVQNKGTGEPGNITINLTEDLVIEGVSDINAFVEGENAGSRTVNDDTGNIVINARAVRLFDHGRIQVLTRDGAGNAGRLQITADLIEIGEFDPERLSRSRSGFFSGSESRRNRGSSGAGGDIILRVRLLRLGTNAVIDSSTDGESPGGQIDIIAERIELLNGGQMEALTSDEGDAGSINLRVSDELLISGTDPRDNRSDASGISTFTEGRGAAGRINIQDTGDGALDIIIQDGGTVSADAREQGAGDDKVSIGTGGDIVIQGRLVRLENNATIDSSTDRNARGGNITIAAERIELLNGGQLVASTSAEGEAGSINLTASDEVRISGVAPESEMVSDEVRILDVVPESDEDGPASSGIFTVTEGRGAAGRINIQEASDGYLNVVIQSGGAISARALAQGDAGNIIINISDQLMVANGDIRTDASQSAGGGITIGAGNILLLGDGDILTNVASGAGNGGNIVITADYLIALDDSDILAFAQDGAGGNITLPIFFGQNFILLPPGTDPNSLDLNARVDVNASGQLSSGAIVFPDVSFIENNLTELPDTLVNTDTLVANSCISAVAQGSGQLVLTGGDGLSQQPETAYSSMLPTGTVRSWQDDAVATAANGQTIGHSIVEPQAVYQLSDGRLVMSRDCS